MIITIKKQKQILNPFRAEIITFNNRCLDCELKCYYLHSEAMSEMHKFNSHKSFYNSCALKS